MTFLKTTQRALSIAAVAGATLLAGCAAMNSVDSSVATFGTWPADRTPGTYAFDRLPSQEANPQRQQAIENAAAQALATAGFRPAADGARPAVTIQIGARIERFEASPWDDPFWFRGRGRFGYPGAWGGPFYGPGDGFYGRRGGPWAPWPAQPDVYLHEVALLIRDGETGKPLYETRASTDGHYDGGDRMLAAMFDASLKDFPHANEKAHNVRTDLPLVPSAATPVAPAASASKA
jgi:hypothetical protein